jgi:hypothetical protein
MSAQTCSARLVMFCLAVAIVAIQSYLSFLSGIDDTHIQLNVNQK